MERSNPLHNFNLPLAWGKHKFLGCRNVYENESDGADEFNENPLAKNGDKRLGKQSSDDPRKNLRFKRNTSSGKDVVSDDVSDGEDEIWATREKLMGEYKLEIGNMKETTMKIGECGGSGVGVGDGSADMEIDDPPADKKTIRPRRNLEKKEERPRFSLTLSRKEIEDDFFAMTGKKPPRRPKRRSRAVQAQINGLFPGSMLSEPHEDRYKV
ncbi:zinc finger, CCHC-type containing protein [Tanacetum coccineum]|uniref:Zinc finger, CCHC-type containing protein n=1 Tax=Tanacetum coccineum TaxID=301880 RepID=A0ABQ5DU97_9ASTR